MVKSDRINKENEKHRQYSEMVSAIFEMCPDAISLTRVSDGEIIDCNPEFLNQIGYSREEVIGYTTLELGLYNSNERNVFINEIRRKQAISDFEILVKRKDNVLINVLCSGRFITVNGIQTLLNIGKDITERKRIEDQLQVGLKRFYSILSNMYGSVLLVSDANKVEFANQAFCDYFNLKESPHDLIGLKDYEMLEKIKNNYVNPNETILHIKEIVNLGKPVKGEEVDLIGNRTCIRDFIPIYINKKFYGRVWHHMDISVLKKAQKELKVSEERYHTLFNSMLEGLAFCKMIYDDNNQPIDWIYIDVNNAFEEITGLENIVGKKITETMPGIKESNPELFEIYSRVALTGKPETFEVNIKQFNVWLNVSVFSPEKEYFVAAFEDIGERKKFELDLIELKNNLKLEVKERTAELEKSYKSLKESEAHYQTLFNSIDEGFCTIEVIFDHNDKPIDYRFLEINPAFERETGLIDAQGKLISDL